jgi:hypothetical protein
MALHYNIFGKYDLSNWNSLNKERVSSDRTVYYYMTIIIFVKKKYRGLLLSALQEIFLPIV